MKSRWIEELWQLLIILFLGTSFGLLIDQTFLVIVVFLFLYIFRTIYNLKGLLRWLDDPSGNEIPSHFGAWGSIYAKVSRMRSSHHSRERKLNRMLGEFQSSAAALPDVTITLGEEGEIRWFNKAAKKILKFRSPQDIGQPLTNLIRLPELRDYLRDGDFKKPLEISIPGNNQKKLSIRITNYGNREKLLLGQDITDRIMAEQIRRDFVGNVSHELRTPLTIISGFIENMQHGDKEIPNHWEAPMAKISNQTSRMKSIVEDLLLLTKLENAKLDDKGGLINMKTLADNLCMEGDLLSKKEIIIKANIESRASLKGDLGLIRSAFTNLLTNAIRHTPINGEIKIEWLEGLDSCIFSVEDSGEGISPEHLPRLTERFYRVDVGRSRDTGGTGLGLAIVKQILQKHDATLEIKSSIGRGSRFSCLFPKSRCFLSKN